MTVGKFRRFLDRCKGIIGKAKEFGRKAVDLFDKHKDKIKKGIDLFIPNHSEKINKVMCSGVGKLRPILKE